MAEGCVHGCGVVLQGGTCGGTARSKRSQDSCALIAYINLVTTRLLVGTRTVVGVLHVVGVITSTICRCGLSLAYT